MNHHTAPVGGARTIEGNPAHRHRRRADDKVRDRRSEGGKDVLHPRSQSRNHRVAFSCAVLRPCARASPFDKLRSDPLDKLGTGLSEQANPTHAAVSGRFAERHPGPGARSEAVRATRRERGAGQPVGRRRQPGNLPRGQVAARWLYPPVDLAHDRDQPVALFPPQLRCGQGPGGGSATGIDPECPGRASVGARNNAEGVHQSRARIPASSTSVRAARARPTILPTSC